VTNQQSLASKNMPEEQKMHSQLVDALYMVALIQFGSQSKNSAKLKSKLQPFLQSPSTDLSPEEERLGLALVFFDQNLNQTVACLSQRLKQAQDDLKSTSSAACKKTNPFYKQNDVLSQVE
jgi:hypothetical protein